MGDLRLHLRRQRLTLDEGGHRVWRTVTEEASWPAAATALLLCDVWDSHWCRGARERMEPLVPRINETVRVAREAGVQIVHAPSGTMDHYEEHPARLRALEATPADPPEGLPQAARDPDSLVGQLFAPGGEAAEYDPPLPVDAADNGTTTAENDSYKAWTSQHPGIEIDPERDLVSDDGRVVYACLQARGVTRMLILGVHTNMCVLHRSFGIKQMTKWGVETVLIRDLTDTMYSPARPPYVDHDEGTRLVVGYAEKFWCWSVDSADVAAGPAA